jgi:hypothetical protein
MELLKKESFQSVLLAAGMIILAAVIYFVSTRFMYSAAKRALKPLKNADNKQEIDLQSAMIDSIPELKTLKMQYETIKEIKTFHMDLAVAYHADFYAFSMCSILFITLLSIGGFLVVNAGWSNTSLLLKSFVLSATFVSSIFYFLPRVVCNEKNISKNANKVIAFQSIQSEILVIAMSYNSIDKSKINSMVANIYKLIAANYDFINTIDNSKLNTSPQEILKSLNP